MEQPQQNLDLTLNGVKYDENYKLLSGSATQVVRGLNEMLNRVREEDENDAYKKALYPRLRELVSSVVNRYETLLVASNPADLQVRYYNLSGYSGSVRKVNNKVPFVKNVRPATTYKFANFGDFLKVLRQRCSHISSCSVPQRYLTDQKMGDAFTKMCSDVKSFNEFLDGVANQWTEVVSSARNAGGAEVARNLEKRNTRSTGQRTPQENTQQEQVKVRVVKKKPETTEKTTNTTKAPTRKTNTRQTKN